MPNLADLEKKLGIIFNDSSFLQQALVHSSYYNENPDAATGSNERLEFLGDAVLGLFITEKLFGDFPDLNEGEMTRLRAALVCRDMLHSIARSIGLGEYLFLGRGEEASGGRRKPANLARALEALIAAIFLDQGFVQAKESILRLFSPELNRLINNKKIIDYKSRLQEFVQAKQQLTPAYYLIDTLGPEHIKQFTIEVRIGDKVIGKGTGRSKKTAEAEAARSALETLSTLH